MLVYGASGHGKVVLDCLIANNEFIDGIFDDNLTIKEFQKYPVIGSYNSKYLEEIPLLIAIGNNYIRQKVCQKVFHDFGKVSHPSALISKFSKIDEGTVVFHNAVIQAGSQIGKHCIINTSASIDHDAYIEDFVHISPNATLSGTVKIGEGSWLGSGSVVNNNISIGKWCVIGAGAVIIKDVPDYSVVVGNPGKIIKQNIL